MPLKIEILFDGLILNSNASLLRLPMTSSGKNIETGKPPAARITHPRPHAAMCESTVFCPFGLLRPMVQKNSSF